MPGLHRSLSLASGAGFALGEGADDAEHVVDLVRVGVTQLPHRLVEGARQRPPQRLVGARFELAGAPALADRGRPQRVEQHRLADPPQPGQHEGPLRAAAGHPLEHDVEGGQLLVAAGELGRPLAGAGGVRIPDRVHDRTVSGCLAGSLEAASVSHPSAEGGRHTSADLQLQPRMTSRGTSYAGRPRGGTAYDVPADPRTQPVSPSSGRTDVETLRWRRASTRVSTRSGTSSGGQPERAGAKILPPQRHDDEVGLLVPAHPQRAIVAPGVEEDRARPR